MKIQWNIKFKILEISANSKCGGLYFALLFFRINLSCSAFDEVYCIFLNDDFVPERCYFLFELQAETRSFLTFTEEQLWSVRLSDRLSGRRIIQSRNTHFGDRISWLAIAIYCENWLLVQIWHTYFAPRALDYITWCDYARWLYHVQSAQI